MPLEISNTPFEIDGSKYFLEMSDGVTNYMGEFVFVDNLGVTPVTYNYVNIYNQSSSILIDPILNPKEYVLVKSSSATDQIIGDLIAIKMLITSSNESESNGFVIDAAFSLGSGSWIKQEGVTQVLVQCWGGGGAGGGANSNDLGGGGGAGGQYSRKLLLYSPSQQNISYVVGDGGLGSTGNGESGKDTTFDVTEVLARGGQGGLSSTNFGERGIATTDGAIGSVVYRGNDGQDGNFVLGTTARGGFGGGGPGNAQNAQGNNGGRNYGGTGGSIVEVISSGQIGNDGGIHGSGGSGAAKVSGANRTGGNGSFGTIIVIYK